MSTEPENLTLRIVNDLRKEVRANRAETREILQVVLGMQDQLRRIDRHITDISADLETMLKAELLGRFANLETRLEQRIDEEVERRLAEAGSHHEPLSAEPGDEL